MSSRYNDTFLEELREARRLDHESREESSESAHGREPAEGSNGGDDVAQSEYLVSPGECPLENDNPRESVEKIPDFQVLEDETRTQTKRPMEANPNYKKTVPGKM